MGWLLGVLLEQQKKKVEPLVGRVGRLGSVEEVE
jgi:hypothetical protein